MVARHMGATGFLVLGCLPVRGLIEITSLFLGETFVWFRFPLFAMAVAGLAVTGA